MALIEGERDGRGLRFAIIVSRFNDFVTSRLLAAASAALGAAGVRGEDVTTVRVPGAFEIPLAAQAAAETGQYHAIICLGCVIRGETPHFEFIASAVSHGLTSAAAATGVPMTFGVLTTNSVEEALARAGDGPDNKGYEAAMAALETASLLGKLKQPAR